MTLPCIFRFVLTALGGFWIGLALGLWRVRALRADVATWHALAANLHDENSRLRLSALVPPRRQP